MIPTNEIDGWVHDKLMTSLIEPAPRDPAIQAIWARFEQLSAIAPITSVMQERNRQIGCLLNLDLTGLKIWMNLK